MTVRYLCVILLCISLAFFLWGRDSFAQGWIGKWTEEKMQENTPSSVKIPFEDEAKSITRDYKETADIIFMGDDKSTGIEGEDVLEEDSPEYKKTRDLLFVDPAERLGNKPLKLTLEDCIRIALVNNNKIQSTEYGIDAAEAKLMEASATFWPIFEYEWLSAPIPQDVSHAVKTFFEGEMAWWNKVRVAMGIPVYSFGKITTAQDLARGGIAKAKEDRKKERLSTVTQVRQLYYGILLAEELGRLLTNAHNKLSKKLGEKNDGKSPVKKIKAKVFLVELENRLAEARDKEILALEGLRVQMGLSPDVSVMVYSDNLRPIKAELRSFEDYLETALEQRPDVKMVEIGVETRRRMYTLEKRKFLPDIGVGAYLELGRTTGRVTGITTTDDFSDPFQFSRAGVGMRIEGKFDVHGQISRVKKARSDYYQASLEHYMAKDAIGLELKKAYMEAKTSLDDVQRAEKAEQLAHQLTFLTQSNYDIGVGEEDEYYDALQMFLLTKGKYYEAIFNYNVALAILDEKAGIIPSISQ